MDVDWDNLSTSNILYDDSTFPEESQDFESGAMYVPELADLIKKVQIKYFPGNRIFMSFLCLCIE